MKKTIKIPIFKQTCYVFIGEDEYKNFCKTLKIKEEDFECAEGLNCGCFVWISDPFDLGIAVHEFTHYVQVLKKIVGFKDDETEAYLMQYLFEWYYKNVFNKIVESELEKQKVKEDGRSEVTERNLEEHQEL